MSWLSSGLAKIGISKEKQRAITKPLLAAAAPVTGGLSAALIPFVNTKPVPLPASGGSTTAYTPTAPGPVTPQPVDINSAIAQGFAAFFGGLKPTAPIVGEPVRPAEGVTSSAPQPITTMQRWGMPLALAGGGVLLAVLLLRR